MTYIQLQEQDPMSEGQGGQKIYRNETVTCNAYQMII